MLKTLKKKIFELIKIVRDKSIIIYEIVFSLSSIIWRVLVIGTNVLVQFVRCIKFTIFDFELILNLIST